MPALQSFKGCREPHLGLLYEMSTACLWYLIVAFNRPANAASEALIPLQAFLHSWELWAVAAELLVYYQRQQGFEPTMPAAETHELFLLLKHALCSALQLSELGGEKKPLQLAAVEVARQLCCLNPTSTAFWFMLGSALRDAGDYTAAARVLRNVLQAAQASNGAGTGQPVVVARRSIVQP